MEMLHGLEQQCRMRKSCDKQDSPKHHLRTAFQLNFFFPGSCLSYLPDLILAVDLADLPTWFKSGAASLL